MSNTSKTPLTLLCQKYCHLRW